MANKNNNNSRLKTWFGKIQEKKRIIVLDIDNYEEKRSYTTSKFNLFVLSTFCVIVLGFLAFTLISYSSLKTLIPGYPNPTQQQQLKDKNIIIDQKLSELIEKTDALFSPENNTETKFYELREQFNALDLKDIKKSALFIYLNKHAFNGLCRYNRKGFFNVPFGRYKAPKCPVEQMRAFSVKAKFATFKCQDFERTFKETLKGDVIYCDPPYVPLSITSSFTSYSKDDFDMGDQSRLAKSAIASQSNGDRKSTRLNSSH